MKAKSLFLEVVRSRAFMLLWFLSFAQTVTLIILVSLYAHPSQLQNIANHFSVFDSVGIVRGDWIYLWNFAAFALAIFILNSAISLKIFATKGRSLALGFISCSIAAMVIIMVLNATLLRVAGIS